MPGMLGRDSNWQWIGDEKWSCNVPRLDGELSIKSFGLAKGLVEALSSQGWSLLMCLFRRQYFSFDMPLDLFMVASSLHTTSSMLTQQCQLL